MTPLTQQDESKLIAAITRAIRYTHEGQTPNQALAKVASEEKYAPEFVARMVEAFNRSKSVHVLKTASADERAKPFELADTTVILKDLYPTAAVQKQASAAVPPHDDALAFSGLFVPAPAMQKSASVSVPVRAPAALSPASQLRRLEMYAATCSSLHSSLYSQKLAARHEVDQAIGRLSDLVLQLPESALHKVAQTVYNGYPENGQQLLQILARNTRRTLPTLEKTASAVVFPTREPYITIAQVYALCEKVAAAERAYNDFLATYKDGQQRLHSFLQSSMAVVEKRASMAKEADGMLEALLAGATGSAMSGMGVEPDKLTETLSAARRKADRPLEATLSPPFFNRLKELDAKRSFSQLMLYDPELSQYPNEQLVSAYNQAVETVPHAYNKPYLLKNLMLRNLQTGGVKDPFELGTEAKMSQTLADTALKTQQARAQQVQAAKEQQSASKPGIPEPLHLGSFNSGLVSGIASPLADAAKTGIAGAQGLAKSILPGDDKPAAAGKPAKAVKPTPTPLSPAELSAQATLKALLHPYVKKQKGAIGPPPLVAPKPAHLAALANLRGIYSQDPGRAVADDQTALAKAIDAYQRSGGVPSSDPGGLSVNVLNNLKQLGLVV